MVSWVRTILSIAALGEKYDVTDEVINQARQLFLEVYYGNRMTLQDHISAPCVCTICEQQVCIGEDAAPTEDAFLPHLRAISWCQNRW